MEAVEVASRRRRAERDVGPPWRFAVMLDEHADHGSAARVQEPARLLRLWLFLQATSEQVDSATLPPEGIPGVQRQLRAIRGELERTVSPPLSAELRRILPAHDATPSAGALRIECAVLVSWAASLAVQTLAVHAAAAERSRQVSLGPRPAVART